MRIKLLIPAIIIILIVIGCTLSKEKEVLTYTGTVEAEQVDIGTEVGGIVKEVLVEEGQRVNRGDRIAVIDTRGLQLQLEQAEASLRAAEARLEELREGARDQEIEKSQANLQNIQALLEGAKKDYEHKLQNLKDTEKLYGLSAVSEKQVEDARAMVDAAYSRLQSLQKQYDAARAQLDLLLEGPTGQKIKMAEAEVDGVKARIAFLKYQISKGEIYSPIEGMIQNIYFDEGEFVPVGGNIATVINLNKQWVKIYVPEKELHRFTLGQQLDLYTGFKGETSIAGEVIYISQEAEFTPKNVESRESKEEMVFAVKVRIKDAPYQLKPGMLVDVRLGGDS